MNKKTIYSGVSVIVVMAIHVFWKIWRASVHANQWAQGTSTIDPLSLYISQQDYFIGLSYALAAGFTVYSLLTFLSKHRAGARGLLSGITVTGLLYFGGCFLVGCCGSPMLPVYLSLFGSSFLGFAKPMVFGLTLISVVLGFWWVRKNNCSSRSNLFTRDS